MHFALRALFFLFILLCAACANPGGGPDGGPFDETPPRVLSTSIEMGKTGLKHARKITLHFSENVKIDNAQEKVVIAPPQLELPDIQVYGRTVSVELLDSLKSNTTYTIDFSDGIVDATEGNPLGHFTFYFSTGETIDTLQVSGKVLDAFTLEPAKGMLVGLQAADSAPDSLFCHAPFLRVSRTNEAGEFSIKGIAAGNYRIYALGDIDGDYKWSRGEALAFTERLIQPSSFPDVRHDTIWADSTRIDSIGIVPFTHFTPDDILLLAFKENPSQRALLKVVRDRPERFTAYFTAPSTTPPRATLLHNGNALDALEDRNARLDTITYWLNDPAIRGNDSLEIVYHYEATNDSTFLLEARADTLLLIPQLSNARLAKLEAEAQKKWEKEREKRHKRGDFSQETRPVEPLKLTIGRSQLTPMQNLTFQGDEPLLRIDSTAFHLFLREDSVLTPAPFRIEPHGRLGFKLKSEWRTGQSYELRIDSAAIVGFSGKVSSGMKRQIGVLKAEDMGSLFVTLSNAPENAVVQLLSSASRVEAQVKVVQGEAAFYYIKPADYFLRLYADHNDNLTQDTGDFASQRQAEHSFYYGEKINVRPNWDTELTWAVEPLGMHTKKPAELAKFKGKQKQKSAHERNLERAREKRGETVTDKERM